VAFVLLALWTRTDCPLLRFGRRIRLSYPRRSLWNSPLGAAASGLALVASEHAGATLALIKDGESGLVFDPHNEHALVELVAKLPDSPKLVRDLGLAAYNSARLQTPECTAEKDLSAIRTVRYSLSLEMGVDARPPRRKAGPRPFKTGITGAVAAA
jgi:glycosyltransferase involved in cell wall biosynthesis